MGFGTKCRKKFEKCFQKARFWGVLPSRVPHWAGWVGGSLPGVKKKRILTRGAVEKVGALSTPAGGGEWIWGGVGSVSIHPGIFGAGSLQMYIFQRKLSVCSPSWGRHRSNSELHEILLFICPVWCRCVQLFAVAGGGGLHPFPPTPRIKNDKDPFFLGSTKAFMVKGVQFPPLKPLTP